MGWAAECAASVENDPEPTSAIGGRGTSSQAKVTPARAFGCGLLTASAS